MNFKPEVIADTSGKWVGNALVFASKAEAEGYARNLSSRWMAVREWRVVESAEPANYGFVDGRLVDLPAAPPPAA